MSERLGKAVSACLLGIVALLSTVSANAQVLVNPEQLLGTVEAVSPDRVLDMNVDDPERLADFDQLFADGQNKTDYVACARIVGDGSGNGGLFCLDQGNKVLKQFDGSTLDPGFFNCDWLPAIAASRRGGDCIAYTAATLDGLGTTHAIAANAKGQAVALNAVVVASGSPLQCPVGLTLTNSFCVAELYTSRPLLNDLKSFFGAEAEGFSVGAEGTGFFGVEQRGDFVFYPYPLESEPIVIADKKTWGIKGKDEIQGAAILRLENVNDPDSPFFYAIVTVNDGRVLAHEVGGSGSVVEVFDLTDLQSGAPLSGEDPLYGISIDDNGIAVATDRAYRQVTALLPQTNVDGSLDMNAGFAVLPQPLDGTMPDPQSLSTDPYDPVAVTLSDGKFINFFEAGCGNLGGCLLISGEVDDGARLELNVVDPNNAEGIFYHVRGLPMCAQLPFTCIDILERDPGDPADDILDDLSCPGAPTRVGALQCLVDSGVLRLVDGAGGASTRPEEYEYNYQPLLVDLIPNAENFPALWTGGPDVRGRLDNQGFVGLLFFVTEAQEQDVATLEIDVAELLGDPGGPDDCELVTDLPPGFMVEDPGGLERLLDWNVIHRTSDLFASFTGDNTGTWTNAGCGSTRGRAGGVSGFLYNVEPSWCPGTLENGVLVFDSQAGSSSTPSCTLGETAPGDDTWYTMAETPDDAVFAKAYASLFVDLRSHLEILLCAESSPGADDAILAQSDCSDLRDTWRNAQDKLRKALDATIQSSTSSAGAQNFGAVQSQLDNYLAEFQNAGPVAPADDPANYYGEHIAWLERLAHIRVDKLDPSVPDDGYVEDFTEWAEVNYTGPNAP